jgi:hypothetical protein
MITFHGLVIFIAAVLLDLDTDSLAVGGVQAE